MNAVLQDAARSVQLIWVSAVMTAVFFALFIAFIWWSFLPRNRQRFDDAARMPLSDGDEIE